MKKLSRELALSGILALTALVAPASGQAGAEPTDSLSLAGMIEGTTAAEALGTSVWTIGGFAGGLTMGPIGAGFAWAVAESSASALPPDEQSKLGRKGSQYALAYQRAYTERLIARRKRATLVGSAAGTALLAVSTVAVFMRVY